MDIGRLKHRITFLGITEKEDILGQSRQEYGEMKTVWATITQVKDREYADADRQREELTWRIYVRYLPDITADMAVRYKDRTFRITSVVDVDFRHEMLEIICTEKIDRVGGTHG